MKLREFDQARLPLRAPVKYAGLACTISGRTMGKEFYDLEIVAGGYRHQFHGVERSEITINWPELARGGAE